MPKKTLLLVAILAVFVALQPFALPLGFKVVSAIPSDLRPLVVVIVSSTIYNAINASLLQYKTDVERDGFAVEIIQMSHMAVRTAWGVRVVLQEAFTRGLVGVFLVGDVPEVWFKAGEARLPTDMYYKDLDGTWKDTDNDGVYDEHTGNVGPEIWVGRLKASTIPGNETLMINNYFNKNHRYRSGLRVLPWWRALAYIDDDGVEWAQDANSSLSLVDSEVTLVDDLETTNASDYKSRLADPFGYQWVYLMSHGSFDYHNFAINGNFTGGTVNPYEYREMDPRVFFYLLFVCSAARYTERDYLAGAVVFTESYGLLSIGGTDTVYSISFRRFFAGLAESAPIGTAFQDWFLEYESWKSQLAEGADFRLIYYGLTIVGDPTLRLDVRPDALHDLSVSDVNTSFQNLSGTNALSASMIVRNLGSFNETFDVTIYVYGYDVTRAHLSLMPKTFQIVNLTIKQPFQVVLVNGTTTPLNIIVSRIPEEFNFGDNAISVQLNDMAVVLPRPQYISSSWAMVVLIFGVSAAAGITIFKFVSAEWNMPGFLVAGARYFLKRIAVLRTRAMKRRRKTHGELAIP